MTIEDGDILKSKTATPEDELERAVEEDIGEATDAVDASDGGTLRRHTTNGGRAEFAEAVVIGEAHESEGGSSVIDWKVVGMEMELVGGRVERERPRGGLDEGFGESKGDKVANRRRDSESRGG